tara:strand:- start:702 stop:923 length:222 start_codon:yes stop_codon:yes gene_type:complete
MPYNEIIEGARVRTDTTIAIDKTTAKTLRELALRHDKTIKAMMRQIIREWMEQGATASAAFAEYKARMSKGRR